MDRHSHQQPMIFLTGLRSVQGFLSRLVNLVSLTQQDLQDAGVISPWLYN